MRPAAFVAILLAPSLVAAAPQTFQQLAAEAINILNAGIGVVLVLGIVVYFYGVSTSINKMSMSDTDKLKAHFFWGVIALFVMFSVWGILALIGNTLFSGSYGVGRGGEFRQCSSYESCLFGDFER